MDATYYESIVGVWAEFKDISTFGVIATDEATFAADGSFEWREIIGLKKKQVQTRKIEGRWRIEDEILYLDFTSNEDPTIVPRHRRYLRVIDRAGRLGLKTIRLDDEVQSNGRMYFLKPAKSGDAARSHEIAVEKLYQVVSLGGPFRPLLPLLTDAIPIAVGRLELTDPLFCIRLYYHDTHAPREDFCTWVRVLTEPVRQHILATKRQCDVPYHLWDPRSGEANGLPGRDPGLFEADLTGFREIMKLYAEVYDELSESDDGMTQLRTLLQGVSRNLNSRDWSNIAPVTDDFVVFPADGSGYYGGDYELDLEESIPPPKLALLRQRNLLG